MKTRSWLAWSPEQITDFFRYLPEASRASLLALFRFARGLARITDVGGETMDKRRRKLLAIEETLVAHDRSALPPFAHAYFDLGAQQPKLISLARDLMSAFVQDTLKTRYRDADDWLDYCQRAVAPLGRAVLIILGEAAADGAACDAFCQALHLLISVQNCGDDYLQRDRVNLPLEWFAFARADVMALASSECSRSLRRVLDRALDNGDTLLGKAAALPASLADPASRRQAVYLLALAERLSRKLRLRDPLAQPVRLNRVDFLAARMKLFLQRKGAAGEE